MHPGGTSRWRRYLPDLVIGTVLLVAALLLRGDGMPTDGLWLDDAIPAAGINASWSELLTVGNEHPGFIALLKAWDSVTGASPNSLAIIPLVAGVAAPALLYAALRWLGSARSVSALLGASLAVAEAHIVYSGRVKSYTLDLLVVLIAFVVVPRLATMTWRWSTALVWVVLSLLIGTLSGFALIALGVAGLVLIAHPAGDLRVRLVAVATQGIASVALLIAETQTYATSNLEVQWRQEWDAFVDFTFNPVELLSDSFVHLRRIGEAFVGGSAWIAAVCIVVALIAMAIAARKGRLGARYLLLVLIAALLASLLGKLPFGPTEGSVISNGQRVSLWLIPVIAVGVAYALTYVRGRANGIGQSAFDLVLFVGVGVILATALSDSHEPYPYSGSATAVSELIEEAGPDDPIVLPWPSQYSFSVESDLGDGISAAPESAFGFEPTFSDPRVHPTGVVISGDPARAVADAEGVHLYFPDPFNSVENGWRRTLNSSLRQLGFEPDPPVTYGVVERQSWREGGAPLRNLGRADVPAGWSVVPTPAELSVFACFGLPMRGAVRTAVLTASPDPEDPVIVVSEIVRWPSPRLGEAANKAFRSGRASRCVGSAFEAQANQLGFTADVNARPLQARTIGGVPAVEFEVEPRGPNPTPTSVVVLTGPDSTSFITASRFAGGPLPRDELDQIVDVVASRLKRTAASGG